MAAPKGNKFWQARSSHGVKPKFDKAEDLWGACLEYFQWVEDNPLQSTELVKFQGSATHAKVPKMRAMTIEGLCIFLDITSRAWRLWRDEKEDFLPIIMRVEAIIYQQKFTGAAADLLNPNIIARDLGLTDKKEHEVTGVSINISGPLAGI